MKTYSENIVFFLLMCFGLSAAYGQEKERIVVKSGEDVSSILAAHGMYRFPSFTDGVISFRDGREGAGKLNYNVYLNLLQFISPKGDTLALSKPETIDSATVGKTVFFYRDGYCQVMENLGNVKLLMKQQIDFRPVKRGAFDLPANSTGAQTYSSLSNFQVVGSKLSFNEDIIVIRQTAYFLLGNKYHQEPASIKGFSTLFPKASSTLPAFVKAQKTNFGKLEDLQKLLAFCSEQ